MTTLATPRELVDLLDLPVKEAQANLALALASDVVRAYCGWRIDRATETLTVDGDGYARLLLPTLAVHEVTAVRVDGAALSVLPTVSSSGVLIGAGVGRIEVDVDHGYDPVPGDIKAVVLSSAKRVIINPQGLRSVTLPTGYAEVYTIPATGEASDLTLTGAERRILDRHRLFA